MNGRANVKVKTKKKTKMNEQHNRRYYGLLTKKFTPPNGKHSVIQLVTQKFRSRYADNFERDEK